MGRNSGLTTAARVPTACATIYRPTFVPALRERRRTDTAAGLFHSPVSQTVFTIQFCLLFYIEHNTVL